MCCKTETNNSHLDDVEVLEPRQDYKTIEAAAHGTYCRNCTCDGWVTHPDPLMQGLCARCIHPDTDHY
jgi:hypothetical protein